MSTSNSIEIAQSDQELVGSAKKRKQFFILGGLCVLAVVVILAIVLSIVFIKKGDDNKLEELQLTDILNGLLQPKRFNGTWIDDKSFYFWDLQNNFVVYDVIEKRSEIIVDVSLNISFFSASSFEFSADKKFILSATLLSKIFRHSFLAAWSVYDVENKKLIPITIGGQEALISLVKFNPVDNSMILVYKNNIYYKKSPTDPEIQITNDGSGNVYNGVPDWVNEEEVFSSNSATWFSPDGKKIAYIRFDDTSVHLMSLPFYGRAGDTAFQYPETISVNYPKVNTKNPEVKLFYVDISNVVDALSVVRSEVATPTRFINIQLDHLITSVSWATNNDLIAVYMNRVQNKGEITKCDTSTTIANCAAVLDLDVTNGWVEFFSTPLYNKEGNAMVFIGSSGGYRHVISLMLNAPFTRSARTSGNFVVTEILAYNTEENVIIFTANLENDSKAQHIYAVKNEEGAQKTCLSCGESGYTYFAAEVSKSGNNLAVTNNGPDVPQVHLYSLSFANNNVTFVNHMEMQSNDILRKTIEGKKLPRVVYDKITLDNGSESQVIIWLPADLDESVPHPMIVEVYGGPDSSSVTNKWAMEWGTYLVSAHNFIYAKIDGRGSGLRGDENLFKLYRKLGTVEVEDQIETAKKLQEKYSYIDKERTAIWGWSYGGYVSGMSLATDQSNVYKCAVSVAPVTDWTLYDSIYTERYMGLPTVDDNLEAYTKSRMMNYVQNFEKNNKTYMLVHGTLDDNVHFQQGMLLARTLEREDIQFKEISYPDEDHSLAGVRPHLYHSLERFFRECFE